MATETRPGFQWSTTSRMEATFYRHGDDPVVVTPAEHLPVSGRHAQDRYPCLVAADTSKVMGSPSGSFVLQMKPSRTSEALFDQLVDDDWVDITVYRHDQPWHTMRGLVDEIRRSKTVSSSGATSEVYTITGRDIGKIWEITPVWFSPYANDIVTRAVANRVFAAKPEVLGNPGEAVKAFMVGFMEEVSKAKGPGWAPPDGVPNVDSGGLLNSVSFLTGPPYFQNLPARKAFNPGFLQPQGTLWSLAQQFSDPMFTELYVDTLPMGGPFSGRISSGEPTTPEDTTMTVVLRDKPFPAVDIDLINILGYDPKWKKVPVLTVPRQQILFSDLGRSGLERFNAYFVAGVLHQELMGAHALNIIAPLLDRADIQRHGFRRMDVSSNMSPDESELDPAALSTSQRQLLRDWYCLNPYMLNGSIRLGVGRPDIRIGCRVRVPATVDEGEEETYYVEQVDHFWTFGSSVKTTLGVTRGWRGDDDSYLTALLRASGRHVVPLLKTDAETGFEEAVV